MPLANSNQNPDGAEAPAPQAVNQNSWEIMLSQQQLQLLTNLNTLATNINQVNNNVGRVNNTLDMERVERIESQKLLQSNFDQHMTAMMMSLQQLSEEIKKNNENVKNLTTAMKISNDTVVGLTAAISEGKTALEEEGKLRREDQKLLQSKVDQHDAGILKNEEDIRQLQRNLEMIAVTPQK